MRIKIQHLCHVLIFLIHPFVVQATTTIDIGSDLGPPHMLLDRGQAKGIDVDVVKHLLKKLDIDANFHFVGLASARKEVTLGKLDAVVPTFIQEDTKNLFVSVPVVSYLPTVFSLAENNFYPAALHDLKAHSIVSFQGATGYFGRIFQDIAKRSPYYLELSNM